MKVVVRMKKAFEYEFEGEVDKKYAKEKALELLCCDFFNEYFTIEIVN